MKTLTDQQIAALNQARTILQEHADDWNGDKRTARVVERADAAEHAIFKFLSAAHVYGDVPMRDSQLHNRPVLTPVA